VFYPTKHPREIASETILATYLLPQSFPPQFSKHMHVPFEVHAPCPLLTAECQNTHGLLKNTAQACQKNGCISDAQFQSFSLDMTSKIFLVKFQMETSIINDKKTPLPSLYLQSFGQRGMSHAGPDQPGSHAHTRPACTSRV
jgi:hypothetical protein